MYVHDTVRLELYLLYIIFINCFNLNGWHLVPSISLVIVNEVTFCEALRGWLWCARR